MLFAVLAQIVIKMKQPTVLGQILIGCGIGILAHYKISVFPQMIHEHTLAFLAELGSILLLFEIGLESNIKEIAISGKKAAIVAITGVIVPFILGYFILAPMLSQNNTMEFALFTASMLAVTSTGISVSVFKDMGIIKQQEAQIVLGASILDDIAGLILLSIITGMVTVGQVDITHISLTIICVVLFFIFSFLMGKLILPQIIKNFTSKISITNEMLTLTLITFCLFLSWVAQIIGLASIIGAFMAGLLIKQSYFSKYPSTINEPSYDIKSPNNNYIIGLITSIGKFLVPIFFIYAGMQVDIISALNIETIKLAALLSIFAIASKCVSGMFLPKGINKWLVGFGMVPRGEIGIIFALSGLKFNLINNTLFTALLLMIVITSVITPIMLTKLNKNNLN